MTPQERIATFADITVPIDVELDRQIMSVRQILGLEEGSVIKLGRSAGENIDIIVGSAFVASGEIVVLEDNMGVRITDFNEGM
jgi:flagellar motor switch protein FliN/FliY